MKRLLRCLLLLPLLGMPLLTACDDDDKLPKAEPGTDIASEDNVNRNPTAASTDYARLEFPRLKGGDNNVVPVIAPITHDGNCNLLFNETDAMAAEAAKALALRYEVKLIYCFEKNGVLLNVDDNDSVIAVLKRSQYKNMREMDLIKDWFVNKLDNAFSAIDHGVKEVIITNAVNLANPNLGTHIK
mgnify:CR=1 FL=1